MIEERDDDVPDRIPPPDRSGAEILEEVERLKREPARFRCLGMSFAMLVVVLLAVWLLNRLL